MLLRPVLSTKTINHLLQVSGITKQCGIPAVVDIQAELKYIFKMYCLLLTGITIIPILLKMAFIM